MQPYTPVERRIHPSSLRITEVLVLLVNEDEGGQNSQIKPEGGLLAVSTGRLPHLKPFAADNHKAEGNHRDLGDTRFKHGPAPRK